MKILFFNWRDIKNPRSGGAEVVNEELAKRLVKSGYEVIFIVGGFTGGKPEETINGYKIIRVGGRWSVYYHAYRYYKKHLVGWADVVIDEVNTVPFFCRFYVKEKNILLVYQLCREIWFYQMFPPLNLIGYLLEPLYLRLLRDRDVITISESSKADLLRFGFKKDKVHIISVGIDIDPVESIEKIEKYEKPTVLSLGTVRAMKRTDQIVRAFEIAKKENKNLELIIAGDASDNYGKRVLNMIGSSPHKHAIQYLGRVSKEKKIELLQKSHLICAASVKEGWGLTITEANSQGTPGVVYNIDGLRDSVKDGETGMVCQVNTPENLAQNIIDLLSDREKYHVLRKKAWAWSKKINFERSYSDFITVIN